LPDDSEVLCPSTAGSAALLETWLLRYSGQGFYIGVGLIEEAVKLAVLWRLAHRLPNRSMLDGLVVGATVGLGFAAFESAGYAFNAMHGATGVNVGSGDDRSRPGPDCAGIPRSLDSHCRRRAVPCIPR
jgi:hypothetical protein